MAKRRRSKLRAHPAADCFPMMDAERFAELKSDIALQGQLQPIVLHDGQILDGRNRYRACRELGVEPTFSTYNGSSPYSYVWSQNAQRRDLIKEQRAAIFVTMSSEIAAEIK